MSHFFLKRIQQNNVTHDTVVAKNIDLKKKHYRQLETNYRPL